MPTPEFHKGEMYKVKGEGVKPRLATVHDINPPRPGHITVRYEDNGRVQDVWASQIVDWTPTPITGREIEENLNKLQEFMDRVDNLLLLTEAPMEKWEYIALSGHGTLESSLAYLRTLSGRLREIFGWEYKIPVHLRVALKPYKDF
jgi:hypothetical protein